MPEEHPSRRGVLFALASGLGGVLGFTGGRYAARPPTTVLDVKFSPRGGCTDQLVGLLDGAKKFVHVAAYQMRSEPILAALVRAYGRSVAVEVILDRSQDDAGRVLASKGVACWIDPKHAIFHHKYVVVDEKTLVTGSFNFSKGAEERNAENMLVIRGQPDLCKVYLADWGRHLNHSDRAEPGPAGSNFLRLDDEGGES